MNYLKVTGSGIHEFFFFERDTASEDIAEAAAHAAAAEHDARRPRGADGKPSNPARISVWKTHGKYHVVGTTP